MVVPGVRPESSRLYLAAQVRLGVAVVRFSARGGGVSGEWYGVAVVVLLAVDVRGAGAGNRIAGSIGCGAD